MYFLGQASNFKAHDILCHTFAFGTPKDSENLRHYLAKKYLNPAPSAGQSTKQSTTTSSQPDKDLLDSVILYGTGRSALASAIKSVIEQHQSDSTKTTTPKKSTTTKTAKVAETFQSTNLSKPAVCATALTCYAVVQAIESVDCEPVFADVNPQTLHFGAEELEQAIKNHPNIRAVIVQNNLGHPADIAGIEKVAKKHHLSIIEDLAHSAGIRYTDGREAGTVGDATILSFGKGKSIDTIAGGACIIRKSAPLPQPLHRPPLPNSMRARWYPFFGACIRGFYHLKLGRYFTSLLLKLHFIERSADAPLSLETRCTHWQAKLALRQLQRLPDPRPPLRDFYFVNHRDQVLRELEQKGFIFNDTWYDIPVAPERYFKKSHFSPQECPVATTLAEQIINVPTHYPESALRPALKIIKRHESEARHD